MDKVYRIVANMFPMKLVYFCGIRILAVATKGKWADQEVPKVTAIDALIRFEETF